MDQAMTIFCDVMDYNFIEHIVKCGGDGTYIEREREIKCNI
jgi:hypothetical protein